MRRRDRGKAGVVGFVSLSAAMYFLAQTAIVILHEHVHSGTAWLLGYSPTPFTVVWGNPLTILGWDEGVPYDQLFRGPGRHPAEAVIGGMPLLMHTIFAAAGLYFLVRSRARRYRLAFYAVYWFVVANLGELVAYLLMRPLAGSGDTGRFNEGLRLSPWPLFLAGNALLVLLLSVLWRKVMPEFDEVLERDRRRHWIVVGMTALLMFLWTSGLRIMALYPDRQWKWGALGVLGFAGWIAAGRPRTAKEEVRPGRL